MGTDNLSYPHFRGLARFEQGRTQHFETLIHGGLPVNIDLDLITAAVSSTVEHMPARVADP